MTNKKAGAEAPTKRQIKNTPKAQVLSILKANRAGVTRAELVRLLNMDDRKIRDYIAELRDQGAPIGIAPGGGYTFGRKKDFERFIKQYEAKVRKEGQRARKYRRALETWDNVTFKI